MKPEICEYLEQFYQTSDTPDAHEKYAESFTKDATLIMASNEVNGREGTLAIGVKVWDSDCKLRC